MPRRQRRVHRARHRRRSASVDTSDSMSTSSSVDSSTNASAIEEITNAITKRAAEISTMVQRRMSLRTSCHGNDDVSDTETERPSHPQEDIGIGTYLSQLKSTVLSKNDQESDERHGMKQILRELRMTQLELKDQELKTTMQIAKMAKMESLEKIQREEIKEVKETIKQKNIMISSLKQEKEELTEKTHMLEKTVKSLTEEISRYEAIVRNSKVLAENQCSLISENEKSIRCLEEKNTELWKKWSNDVSTMKCKDALLNMQRQQMEEQENLLKIYETKFLAKGVDVVKVVARAEEGERLWSKMNEREKRFSERKVLVETLRDENASLKLDKKKMQTEINELKKCFETFNIQLGDTGDKLHMPWLLSQLRNNVALKERINELEDVILGNGYTVMAAEAENDFRRKEFELATEIEKVTRVLEMLNEQVQGGEGGDKLNTCVLIGKLEEALLMYGYEEYEEYNQEELMNDMASAASSDITSMVSSENKQVIVSVPSHESWNGCTVMSGFAEGCSPSRGLFHHDPIGEEEEIDVTMADKKKHGANAESDIEQEEAYESSYVEEDVHLMSISRGSSYTTPIATDDETTLSSKAPMEDVQEPTVRKTRVLRVIVNGVDDR